MVVVLSVWVRVLVCDRFLVFDMIWVVINVLFVFVIWVISILGGV